MGRRGRGGEERGGGGGGGGGGEPMDWRVSPDIKLYWCTKIICVAAGTIEPGLSQAISCTLTLLTRIKKCAIVQNCDNLLQHIRTMVPGLSPGNLAYC